MSTFRGFDKATVLFAENWGVVTAMETHFRANVNEFFDAVRDQVRQNVGEAGLEEKVTQQGYRYWSLTGDGRKKGRPHLLLGNETELPRVVRPGVLLLWATAPDASKEQLARLAEVRLQPDLAPYCEKASGGPYSLFKVKARCTDENAASVVADLVTAVLKALAEAASPKPTLPPAEVEVAGV
jgi:hypothetical protein